MYMYTLHMLDQEYHLDITMSDKIYMYWKFDSS